MSRARRVDNSAAVSLFPFLAVLLCTMGALLVVLVAMTHSARSVALRQAAVCEPPAVKEVDPANREKLEQANQYLLKLKEARAESERKLREEHQRLGHLESHTRRLREQLEKLQLAALELESLEEEHYDDREQAEREVNRLQQLITDTREAIEALKEEQSTKKRSYALVPYEGPNGTTRRPIYIECRKGELILQPEGVRLAVDDLRPPVGPGNPLAAAVRAAREHIMQVRPNKGPDGDTEPYPLVIVRPSGAAMFSPAQRAIQSGDFDFGYELVEEDWDLKYPSPDPQLAAVEQHAVDQARVRQQALAAAAPRAFRQPALAAAGRFEFDDLSSGGIGFVDAGETGAGGQLGNSFGAGGRGGGPDGTGGEFHAVGAVGGTDGPAEGSGGTGGGPQYADAKSSDAAVKDDTAAAGKLAPDGQQAGGAPQGDDASAGQLTGSNNNPSSIGAAGGASGSTSTVESHAGGGGDSSYGATSGRGSPSNPAQDRHINQQDVDLSASRGADWALKRKKPRAVPVRRTIQVVVRNDHIAILSDDARLNSRNPTGKTLALTGDTVEAIDDFVKQVNDQIEGWGMAGEGLYWRPVLALHVGPDGQRRAQDLARLLKNSGLELQSATAQTPLQGEPRATR